MHKVINVIALIALIASGCVKNDCENGSILSKFMTDADLDRRAAEDSPSVRWYWCEAPMVRGGQVPAGKSGPFVNLADGSDFGYGGWVRVLADDVTKLNKVVLQSMPMAPDDGVEFEVYWFWTAAAVFVYDWRDEGLLGGETSARMSKLGALMFSEHMTKHRKTPLGVMCYSVSEVRQQAQDFVECKTPSQRSPVSQSGAETSGSTSGGSTSGGDWGPN